MLPAQPMTAARVLRAIGAYLLNFVVAVAFTNALRNDFILRRGASTTGFLVRDYVLIASITLALGYFVFRRWHWESAKWVWIAGVGLFLQRAVRFWLEQHGPLNAIHGSVSFYWEMSGVGCLSDRSRCVDFGFTEMLVRTIFYSIGALLYMWFREHESAAPPSLKKALLSLRRPRISAAHEGE
jgi:hypothetical protein